MLSQNTSSDHSKYSTTLQQFDKLKTIMNRKIVSELVKIRFGSAATTNLFRSEINDLRNPNDEDQRFMFPPQVDDYLQCRCSRMKPITWSLRWVLNTSSENFRPVQTQLVQLTPARTTAIPSISCGLETTIVSLEGIILIPKIKIKEKRSDKGLVEYSSRDRLPEKLENIDDLTEQITSAINVALKKINYKTKPEAEKLSADTKKLIDDERKIERDTEEFKYMKLQLKEAIRKDLRQYNTKMIQNAIDNNMNMKASRSRGRQKVHKVRNTDGIEITEWSEINNVIREYYAKLYASSRDSPPTNEVLVILNSAQKRYLKSTTTKSA
ncbi:hypothetical protein HHI36_018024 [Cryptolaemus montrouzieri]|uniref:Uncharacterized protein n=1 Tax=Cryptolaemus montrouzieri TaxID=559131 RepID=A0ABD2NYY1_9CUCU